MLSLFVCGVTRDVLIRNSAAINRNSVFCRPHLHPWRHQPERVCPPNPPGLQGDVRPHANHSDAFFRSTGEQAGALSKSDDAAALHFSVVRTALGLGGAPTALESGALQICPARYRGQQRHYLGYQPEARTGQWPHLHASLSTTRPRLRCRGHLFRGTFRRPRASRESGCASYPISLFASLTPLRCSHWR